MWTLIRYIIIVMASICMTACSTTQATKNHLDAGARPHIKTVDAVLMAKQSNISADVKKGSDLAKLLAVTQANVIPLVVDAGVTGVRTFTAHKLSKPMREMLDEYDYPVEFREKLEATLTNGALDGIDNIKIRRKDYDGFRGKYIQESEADAVLFVDMKYAFTSSFDKLYVAIVATMFPNTPELTPYQQEAGNDHVIELSDNIYRNQFAAVIRPEVENSGKYANSVYWASLTQDELIARLDAAGLMLADSLAHDISIDDVSADPASTTSVPDTSDQPDTDDKIEVAPEDIEAVKTVQGDVESETTEKVPAPKDMSPTAALRKVRGDS